ncbi:hypothetical protein JZX86_27730 [Agrobacterium rosae]|nr:hypothetical protein [Agrobacterium rosae]
MGAAMMMAGGPSATPQNFLGALGQGIASGSVANAEHRKDSVALAAARQKQEQLKRGQDLAAGIGGSIGSNGAVSATGLSQEELMKVWRYQIETGDEAGARDTLGMIQQLQQTGAKEGMVVGKNGKFDVAPGYGESLGDVEMQKATGRVAGEEAVKQTDDIREYNLYTEQEKEAGRTPGDFTSWMRQNKKSGSTQVNVNGPNSDKFKEKSDENAAKRFDEIAGAGAGASQMVGDMDLLIDLGRKAKTGKSAEILAAIGPYAEVAGVNIDGLSDIQAYQAVVSRIAPNLRPAGSGATSDFDAKQFLLSIPSIGNTAEGNEVIAVTMQSVAENKIAAAQIANRVQRGEMTWQDGDKEIAALPNPYSRFKESMKKEDKPTKMLGVSVESNAEPAKEAPVAVPTVNSPADVSKLPKTVEFFVTPQGVRKRNPNYGK